MVEVSVYHEWEEAKYKGRQTAQEEHPENLLKQRVEGESPGAGGSVQEAASNSSVS